MGVARWINPQHRSTRAEQVLLRRREMEAGGSETAHGFWENGDPLHLGEGPP
jgi:hypothetical protein